MADDPAGYYATLEVDPGAAPEAIAAAYRRKARVLHPDVAGYRQCRRIHPGEGCLRRVGRCRAPGRLRSLRSRRRSRVAAGCRGTTAARTAALRPAGRGLGRSRRDGLPGRDHGRAAAQPSSGRPQPAPVIRPFAPSAPAARPLPVASGAGGRRAARPRTTCLPCRRRYRAVATRCRARRVPACRTRCRVQSGAGAAFGPPARTGRDQPGRRRHRLHRRFATYPGRPCDGAAGLLRLHCRTVAAERRGAPPSRRGHGTYRDQQPRPAAGGGQAT